MTEGCLASERIERRLTAILAADVAGYSRLVEADEEGTLSQWKALWGTVIEPKIKEHRGRIARVIGDGILAEFARRHLLLIRTLPSPTRIRGPPLLI